MRKKAKLIAHAVSIMEREEMLSTASIGDMVSLFDISGYSSKEIEPFSGLQIVCLVLYQHWRSGKEPMFYRFVSKERDRNIACYSLSNNKKFKSYKELIHE